MLLHDEPPQTVALVLAHLPPRKAARIMAAMDPDRRIEVTRRMAAIREVREEVVREVGRVIGTLDANTNIELLLAGDTFRRDLPKATSIEDIWFYVVFLGCCVFFWDVFFRRVQVSFEWLKPVAAEVRDLVLRRERVEAPAEAIVRLSSRKAEVREKLVAAALFQGCS